MLLITTNSRLSKLDLKYNIQIIIQKINKINNLSTVKFKIINMKRKIQFAKQIILIVILSISMSCSTNTKNNQTDDILEFFTKSELQYDTKQQKESIIIALNDIINMNLSENELKNKKYPNYTGVKNQWNLLTLINKYFVPADKNIILGDNFYTKIKRKEIQKQIQKIIVGLQNDN